MSPKNAYLSPNDFLLHKYCCGLLNPASLSCIFQVCNGHIHAGELNMSGHSVTYSTGKEIRYKRFDFCCCYHLIQHHRVPGMPPVINCLRGEKSCFPDSFHSMIWLPAKGHKNNRFIDIIYVAYCCQSTYSCIKNLHVLIL